MPGVGMRLLIVEDQDLMAMTLASAVRMLNYEIVGSAATSERAVELAVTCHPDVVMMDLHLKGRLDGVETAREIMALTHARIVFVTGATDPADEARMMAVQPVGILFKPFRRTDLASVLSMAAQTARVSQTPKSLTSLTATVRT